VFLLCLWVISFCLLKTKDDIGGKQQRITNISEPGHRQKTVHFMLKVLFCCRLQRQHQGHLLLPPGTQEYLVQCPGQWGTNHSPGRDGVGQGRPPVLNKVHRLVLFYKWALRPEGHWEQLLHNTQRQPPTPPSALLPSSLACSQKLPSAWLYRCGNKEMHNEDHTCFMFCVNFLNPALMSLLYTKPSHLTPRSRGEAPLCILQGRGLAENGRPPRQNMWTAVPCEQRSACPHRTVKKRTRSSRIWYFTTKYLLRFTRETIGGSKSEH
jgi:hypothetical protein